MGKQPSAADGPANALAPSLLAPIPLIDVPADFPYATLVAAEATAHALLDSATRGIPRRALQMADAVSRSWLAKSANAHLPEIDRIATRLARPGAYFLSVNYEWGCTVGVRPACDGQSAELIRVLDWRTVGLGRHVLAARVAGPSGPFITLTWPGYTGVLQALAPGRFAAALNQAPLAKAGGGIYPLDWLVAKTRVWRRADRTAAHLLRDVFEQADSYEAARAMLAATPLAAPAIFSLTGLAPDETCIIERGEEAAYVRAGPAAAANHWDAPGWQGRARGTDSGGRAASMLECSIGDRPGQVPDLSWLVPPILNDRTRLVMIADARRSTLYAQGFEASAAATAGLWLAGTTADEATRSALTLPG